MSDELPPRLVVRSWCCSICANRVQTLSTREWTGFVICGNRGCDGAMYHLPVNPAHFLDGAPRTRPRPGLPPGPEGP